MEKERRYLSFDVQRNYYYETHDENGNQVSDISEVDWIQKIQNEWLSLVGDCCDELLMIVHDKDIIDGVDKGLHVHAVAHLKRSNAKTISAASKYFKCTMRNTLHTESYVDSVRYLIHVSEGALNAMKTIYPITDIIGRALDSNGNVVELTVLDFQQRMSRNADIKKKAEKKNVIDGYVREVISGQATSDDILLRYANDSDGVGLTAVDYIADSSKYGRSEDASGIWMRMMQCWYVEHGRHLTTLYISGSGGAGKDEFAQAFANSVADCHGVHKSASPGKSTTFDFAGNYRGERVSIISDLSPYHFGMEQLLSVLDPRRCDPVSSRNVDKLYFPDYALVTSSSSLEQFIYRIWKPYARQYALLPPATREYLSHTKGISEADWLTAYMQCDSECADRFRQIRRRFAVYVDIRDSKLSVYFRRDKYNVADCFYLHPMPVNAPFEHYYTISYDISSDDYSNQLDEAVKVVKKAIEKYYECNNYKKPEEYEQPDFSAILGLAE